ncbi:hypothetical protein GQX73_g1849 [Xylaria multiplex]|uniref:Xylanolytic transcriptional activator regulatory domain-containing protein n=1 Tax=Xylaria multiplex TaxID=323545 RepID=A0A7C8IT67_9PEZI|nr:hypothetical protein GQX73_g1849 [Xylaria multiplex]
MVTFDSWGRRRDEFIMGWQKLQESGITEGGAVIPYENRCTEYSRVYHSAKYAIWCGSAAWVSCPTLMVDGVASLLRKHLTDPNLLQDQRPVLKNAYERLVSRDPAFAWMTGQWMTETWRKRRQEDGDPCEIRPGQQFGYQGTRRYATDADMMMLLARMPKGISTFLAPMRWFLLQSDVLRNDTELNSVHIQHLKNKPGTRALPTAELELNGVRGWLVGEDGRGTKEIATVLNIARIHNGLTSIGHWARALGVVRAFMRVRMIGQWPLWEHTAFMRSLARIRRVPRQRPIQLFPDRLTLKAQTLAASVATIESQLGMMHHESTQPSSFSGLENSSLAWNTPLSQADSSGSRLVKLNFGDLLDMTTVQSAVDTYFQYCHCQPYCYFQEENFRQGFSENTLPPWLLLAVIATAIGFSNNEALWGRHNGASDYFASVAWKDISDRMFQEDFMTIHTVQAANMLSVIDFAVQNAPPRYKMLIAPSAFP